VISPFPVDQKTIQLAMLSKVEPRVKSLFHDRCYTKLDYLKPTLRTQLACMTCNMRADKICSLNANFSGYWECESHIKRSEVEKWPEFKASH
jgi:hypothetical protein